MTKILNPTIHFHVGYFNLLPYPSKITERKERIQNLTEILIANEKIDWNSFETSWDFEQSVLLLRESHQSTISATYDTLSAKWFETTLKMQSLEEENNRIFIDAYGLQDELTPDVPLEEITLTCNPYYRYGKKAVISSVKSGELKVKSNDVDASHSPLATNHFPLNEELEERLVADTMREFISYAVGCMFGRYSLDKPGLILANQGETVADYVRKVESGKLEVESNGADASHCSSLPTSHCSSTSQLSFVPDEDNVIPILDGDWFTDDIAERFRAFLRVTFGDENYEENLRFIEDALGKKGKPLPIRDYFLKEFYTDHVKRYKKRPIYWLFSSPKGSFNALIYLHRYRPDTVSVVLNDYLRDFNSKLTARKSHLEHVSVSGNASAGEKTKALKDIENLKKILVELADYERDVLYPLATRQLEIDLDDGVKHNYGLFGSALKKIVGLDAAEE